MGLKGFMCLRCHFRVFQIWYYQYIYMLEYLSYPTYTDIYCCFLQNMVCSISAYCQCSFFEASEIAWRSRSAESLDETTGFGRNKPQDRCWPSPFSSGFCPIPKIKLGFSCSKSQVSSSLYDFFELIISVC